MRWNFQKLCTQVIALGTSACAGQVCCQPELSAALVAAVCQNNGWAHWRFRGGSPHVAPRLPLALSGFTDSDGRMHRHIDLRRVTVASSTSVTEDWEDALPRTETIDPADPEFVAPEGVLFDELQAQLQYMLNVMYEAGLFDWAFVIAVLLEDLHAVSAVLEDAAGDPDYGIFSVISSFERAMHQPPVNTHAAFFQRVASNVRQATPAVEDLERELRAPVAQPPASQADSCSLS
eukprot:m.252658 g.252658  ORF g.252658 m.252658 type:complete len:234 (-) comp22666_c0_seq1:49-750(-)